MVNEMKPSMYINHAVHNFSGDVLFGDEYKALSHGLHHHILTFSNYNAVEIEFEMFYQPILSNILHIPENKMTAGLILENKGTHAV